MPKTTSTTAMRARHAKERARIAREMAELDSYLRVFRTYSPPSATSLKQRVARLKSPKSKRSRIPVHRRHLRR